MPWPYSSPKPEKVSINVWQVSYAVNYLITLKKPTRRPAYLDLERYQILVGYKITFSIKKSSAVLCRMNGPLKSATGSLLERATALMLQCGGSAGGKTGGKADRHITIFAYPGRIVPPAPAKPEDLAGEPVEVF